MKKIFVLLALILLIPLTAMAAESSHLKDREWVIAKANQENLWDMDFDTVNQATPLEMSENSSTYTAATPHVNHFAELYNFGENNKLRGIILLTENQKIHKNMEKELTHALGTPIFDQSDQVGWLQGPNIVISFYDDDRQMYFISIVDKEYIAKHTP